MAQPSQELMQKQSSTSGLNSPGSNLLMKSSDTLSPASSRVVTSGAAKATNPTSPATLTTQPPNDRTTFSVGDL
jgi:hypothetical protein